MLHIAKKRGLANNRLKNRQIFLYTHVAITTKRKTKTLQNTKVEQRSKNISTIKRASKIITRPSARLNVIIQVL
jgi:hypothetical protein